MKALLLAGGTGSRLLPFTRTMPKQLLPVANRPVIEHAVHDVRSLGVRDVGVVVGARGRQIRRVLGDGSRLGVRFTYLEQDRPRGLADCVRLARGFLEDDDFLVYLGDNLFQDGSADAARTFLDRRPEALLTVQQVRDPRDFGVAVVGDRGRVLRVVEKPDDPPSDHAVLGAYFLRPSIHEAIDHVTPSARGELELTDALQWLVDRGDEVLAVPYTGYWRDIGRVEDVLDSGRHYLERLEPEIRGHVDGDSSLTGPIAVAAGARIVRSRLTGPVTIGEGTLVEDSVVGPGVAIGRNCSVRATSMTETVVLDGVTVHDSSGLNGCLAGSGGLRRHRAEVPV